MAQSYSVLLVDDDKFLLSMYQKKFEKSGAKVDVAVGSAETLEKLRDHEAPDILILDTIMPTMDGLELLEKIKKEKLAPNATVIMLSNESSQEKIDRAKELGAAGYIVKATSIPSEVVEEALRIAQLNKKN